MYPFFALGTFFFPYEGFRQRLLDNENYFVISIIAYLGTFMLPNMSINIHAFFAILILVHVFAKYESKIPHVLSVAGTYSLEIYVFHWFLLPQLSGLRKFFMEQTGDTLNNGNFILLLIFAGAIAICIASICILITKVIRCSNTLKKICFGE